MMRQTHRDPAKCQEVVRWDERECIDVQSRTAFGSHTMVCWGWKWFLFFEKGRHHKLISFTKGQASFQISLPSLVKLGNALYKYSVAQFAAVLHRECMVCGMTAKC
jgi:hypothetical protein